MFTKLLLANAQPLKNHCTLIPLEFSGSIPRNLDYYYSSSRLRLLPYLDRTVHLSAPRCYSTLNTNAYYASLIDNLILKSHLNQVYARILVAGLQSSSFLTTKLVNVGTSIGEIDFARKLFDEFPDPDVFLWNAIVRCYSRHRLYRDALDMYTRMQRVPVRPDVFTFPCVFKACNTLPAFEMGRCVHGQVFRHGFVSNTVVQNSLVAFYAKCGNIALARAVFDKLCDRTIVSWTSIISGYSQNGQPLEALRTFSKMRKMNVRPDWITLVSILRAYTDVDDLDHGRSIHGYLIKMGLEYELDLLISLTAMYSKCGQVTTARLLFDLVERPNLILWNTIISGYARNGYAEEAVNLFRQMISEDTRPDSITLTSALSASSQVGSLELARWMEEYINRSEFRDDVCVNTALIDMYAKCGTVDLARIVFDRTLCKDVFVWSAMIAGYGLQGQGREAINLFNAMRNAGVSPNDVTFIGLLTACNHSGLVKEGWELFHCMEQYGIKPRNQHYSCVVDLLGRSGKLNQAYNFIRNMPIEPDASVWGAFLGACRIHRNVTLGEHAAYKLFSLDPYSTGHYVQLSNLYASARLWDHVAGVRTLMRERGLSKDLGHSLIEVNGKLHAFHVGDMSYPRSKEIFEELQNLERRLKEAGFYPHAESALNDLNDEETELILCNHSERLAIVYDSSVLLLDLLLE